MLVDSASELLHVGFVLREPTPQFLQVYFIVSCLLTADLHIHFPLRIGEILLLAKDPNI